MPTGQAESTSSQGRGPGGLDAIGAADAVRLGTMSAQELLADAQKRAATFEPDLGAVVTPVGRQGAGGGLLEGAIVAVKDLIAVKGVVRASGAPQMVERGYLDSRPQPADAPVVARTVAAGGTLLSTVATHPLAFGVITPQTQNPVAPGRIIGGSSGGSAAALAAGFCHLALGTDTGGSIRIPASSAGIAGLKTTRGRIPLTGVQPLSWTLDSVGPMATTVADIARYLTVLDGYDPDDPVSRRVPDVSPSVSVQRIGIPRQVLDEPIDPAVRAVWRETLSQLEGRGIEIVEVDLPVWPQTIPAATKILVSEAAAAHHKALEEAPETIHPSVRARMEEAIDLPAWKVGEAHRVKRAFRAELRQLWHQVDLLSTPTLACQVPRVDEEVVNVEGQEMYVVSALKHFVGSWNLAGGPAGSVPAGVDANGAPVGVQFIGPHWGEAAVLDAMTHVEQLTPVARP